MASPGNEAVLAERVSNAGLIARVVGMLVVLPATLLSNLHSLFALGIRWYVSYQFLASGWLKITSWETTISLFENEYHTPVLPPHLAAVIGTFGELFFPALLVVGLTSRLSAVAVFCVNAMAVISYWHVLSTEGFEAALGQHYFWGFMLVVLVVYGPGRLSLDALLAPRAAKI